MSLLMRMISWRSHQTLYWDVLRDYYEWGGVGVKHEYVKEKDGRRQQ
jgi:hypothetical protein